MYARPKRTCIRTPFATSTNGSSTIPWTSTAGIFKRRCACCTTPIQPCLSGSIRPSYTKPRRNGQRFRRFFPRFFRQKASHYHYLSTAQKTYHARLEGEPVKPKKYFYAPRPLLACRRILSKQTLPHAVFHAGRRLSGGGHGFHRKRAALPQERSARNLACAPQRRAKPLSVHNHRGLSQVVQALPDGNPLPWDDLNRLFSDTIRFQP